jgi:hypothetical protein
MRDLQNIAFCDGPLSNNLDGAILRCVLKRLEIEASVPDVNFWKLPVMPGIAFLIALRVLLEQLKSEAPPTPVNFWKQGDVCGVRILLAECRSGRRKGSVAFSHLRGFLHKVKSQRSGEPAEGLSRAIWSLAHARVDLWPNLQDDEWLEMFRNGAGGWVAWPSFVDGGLEFAW